MAKVTDYKLEVSDFKIQPPYYASLRTNTLEQNMNAVITPLYGLNSMIALFLLARSAGAAEYINCISAKR